MKQKIIILSAFLSIVLGCSDFLTSNPNRTPVLVSSQANYVLYPAIIQPLDASESYDVDNQKLDFNWTISSSPVGGNGLLTMTRESIAYFSATVLGTYVVNLLVTDEYGLTDTEDISILINHSAPLAISGAGATLYPGISYPLSGSATDDDPDGTASLSYLWTVESAAGAVGTYFLTDETTLTPSFVTAYYADGATPYTTPSYIGSYTLRLTVIDEFGLTDTSDTVITVANLVPNASIAASGAIPPAPLAVVSLDGSSSTDPDPDRRQTDDFDYFQWTLIDKPVGSSWLWDGTDTTPTFTSSSYSDKDVTFAPGNSGSNGGEGVYTVQLQVSDEYGSMNSETLIIPTLGNTAPVLAPIASLVTLSGDTLQGAGSNAMPFKDDDDVSEDNNDTFNIDASSAITNTDDDTLVYLWTFNGFAGTIDIYVEGSLNTLSPGQSIATEEDSILTLSADGVSVPDGLADFSLTVKVSDGDTALDDTAVMWFDLY